jgi:ankyrin repeat protein
LLDQDKYFLNTQNDEGFSALHYACFNGFEDIAFYLLEIGANPLLINNYGEYAVDSAFSGKHYVLYDKLKKSKFYNDNVIVSSNCIPLNKELDAKYLQIIDEHNNKLFGKGITTRNFKSKTRRI